MSLAIKRQTKQDDEHLIVMTNTFAHLALDTYRRRWSIETFFQSIKQRGFRLEDTHLDDLGRLRKLFALVAIAFTVCLHIGRWSNENQKPIEIKNHGYKANSFFRYGLECWRNALRTMSEQLDQLIRVIEKALIPPNIITEKFSCRVQNLLKSGILNILSQIVLMKIFSKSIHGQKERAYLPRRSREHPAPVL